MSQDNDILKCKIDSSYRKKNIELIAQMEKMGDVIRITEAQNQKLQERNRELEQILNQLQSDNEKLTEHTLHLRSQCYLSNFSKMDRIDVKLFTMSSKYNLLRYEEIHSLTEAKKPEYLSVTEDGKKMLGEKEKEKQEQDFQQLSKRQFKRKVHTLLRGFCKDEKLATNLLLNDNYYILKEKHEFYQLSKTEIKRLKKLVIQGHCRNDVFFQKLLKIERYFRSNRK